MKNNKKIVVVMPAYNAAKTLIRTYNEIDKKLVDKIILVDDASRDDTALIAKMLKIPTYVHLKNRGYGGNQKTCYREALKLGADIVVMLHPDYQYDPKKIPAMIEPIIKGNADLVLGSRLKEGSAMEAGMPVWKFLANRFLTTIENFILKTKLSEMHTGYRAYSKKLLETIPFEKNSEDFVFDSEVIFQTVAYGFKIAEVSVPCIYISDASSINFKRSFQYGLSTLKTAWRFWRFKKGVNDPLFNSKLK